MRRAGFLIAILAIVLLVGCVDQNTELVHLQTEQDLLAAPSGAIAGATATPESTPTAEPIVLHVPEVTGNAFPNDALGIPIVSPDTHYADYYVHYYQIRVYEVGNSTLADMVIDNAFSLPLQGEARLVFTGTDGKEYGYGELHTADGTLTLNVGRNQVYAEILTEVDVQMMEFSIRVTTPFAPVLPE